MSSKKTYPFKGAIIYPKGRDMKKRWFVKYYVWDMAVGDLVPQKVSGPINYIKNKGERLKAAHEMNGLEVIDVCSRRAVDIVIMDLSMPEMDRVEATRELLKKHPDIKVLGLSMFNDRNYISNLLKASAHGYILKNTGKEELVKAIHTLESGESFLGDEVSKTLLSGFMK